MGMFKRIVRNSSLYAMGDLVTRGMNFILLPIYTAFLTPDDFGIIGIANILAMMFPIVFTLGIRGAALKFYYDYEDEEERRGFYGTIWLFTMIVPLLGLLLTELIGRLYGDSLFAQIPFTPYLHLAVLTGFFTAVFITIPRELFRASEKPLLFSLMNLGVFFFSTGFTLWFVVGLKQGAEGALYAKVLGNVIMAFPLGYYMVRYVRFRFSLETLKRTLAYSLPMVPHMLSLWFLSSVGRLVLERHVPLADVGRFNFAFTIASALYLLASAMSNAVVPVYGRLERGNEPREREAVRTTTYFIGLSSALALGMYLFMPEVLELLTPPAYHAAWEPYPLLLLGFYFGALYTVAANVITLGAGNSKVIALATFTTALVNIVLNLVLIPRYGVVGASMAHALSYILFFVLSFSFAQRLLPLKYEYLRIGTFFLVLAGGVPLVPLLRGQNFFVAIACKMIYLAIIAGAGMRARKWMLQR